MKIGINARTFSVDEPGGAVQSAIRLTEELIENPEHEVVLFGASELERKFDAEIQSSIYSSNQIWGIVWERLVLPLLVKYSDIDVLYCPNGNAPIQSIKVPVVMCIHDVNAQKGWSSDLHQLYRRTMVPVAARSCDAVVTVSQFSKGEIQDQLGIPGEKIHVIYNGIDDLYFSDTSSQINLPDDYILFVGSLNPRKNIDGVISGFKQVREDYYSELELVIIGPENKKIFQEFEISPESGVHTLGFLDIEEVKYAYENAEALVFPSYYEGFGLPPVESLACGTEVVASDRGALPEVLEGAATFVNPQDSTDIARGIKRALDRDTEQEVLISQAEKYSWETVATRLVDIFRYVCEK